MGICFVEWELRCIFAKNRKTIWQRKRKQKSFQNWSQIVTSNFVKNQGDISLTSQNVILKKGRGQHTKYTPYAFTRNGIGMLSSVLRSETAVCCRFWTNAAMACRQQSTHATASYSWLTWRSITSNILPSTSYSCHTKIMTVSSLSIIKCICWERV